MRFITRSQAVSGSSPLAWFLFPFAAVAFYWLMRSGILYYAMWGMAALALIGVVASNFSKEDTRPNV